MTWPRGESTVRRLIREGLVEDVGASWEIGDALMTEARKHLESAQLLSRRDPVGAYTMAYEAARRALSAMLESQGLRVTGTGSDDTLYEVIRAQFDPPLGPIVQPFNRMRLRRQDAQYAPTAPPRITPEEVAVDLARAQGLVDLAIKTLPQLTRFAQRR